VIEQESELVVRDLTRRMREAAGQVRRQVRRPQFRHPAASTLIERPQPIRLAITVAEILGYVPG